MLKTGLFQTPNNVFTIYEVEESGYYRIDITEQGAAFQTEPDKVIYSQIRKRNTYIYGSSEVYDLYLRQKEILSSANYKIVKESIWEEGQYITRTRETCEKLGFTRETKSVNGKLDLISMSGGGFAVASYVVERVYDVKLDPLNFAEYVEATLLKDTVSESSSGIFYTEEVLRRRYDLRHIDKKDFVVATTVDVARERLAEYVNNPFPYRGFDTETTGLDICLYGEDKMVGIILSSDLNTSTYFPFRHKGDFNLPMWFLPEVVEALIKLQDRTIAHNKKFDREVMLAEGFDVHCKWDSMQASIVYNPMIGKGIHGLKYLTGQLNGNHFLELDEIFVNAKDIDFSVLPPGIIKLYACPDGTNTMEVFIDLLNKIPKYQYRLLELECDLADVKADQEFYGIRVDVKKYERQYKNCNYIIDMLLKAFRTLTHEDGNINSQPVMVNLLYNKMHCKVLSRTATGAPSTSNNAIKKLAKVKAKEFRNITEDLIDLEGNVIIKAKDLAESAYPALVILSKYREYNKLKTAFYARFERTMKTGRIFFWVNQNGAATGRQSSPMHQLPPELKEVILSDTNSHDFWGPDFSQIELRMIAYLAGERDLIELAKDPDNDIHRIIGSLISNKEMWAITPKERSEGKRRNFGVVYLISAMGLAGQMFGPGYTKENVEFCQQQLDAFYKRFPRIDRFIKRNATLVKQRGYMETKWYHRKRLFPEVFDSNLEPRKLASILRMGNNVPVQGTSADYLKLAEVQMFAYIYKKGWNKLIDGFPMVRLMLSIHDEIIISAHQSIPYEEIIEMITKCMETPVDDAPPFFVQPARMNNWEGHSDDACAMPIRFRDKCIEDYNRTGKSVFHQSYFNLIIPDDVKHEINTSKDTVSELVKRYYSKCTLEFDHGDYVKEFTEEHVKDALKEYILSAFTVYRIDDYIKNLEEFRQNQLRDYMSDLIRQYGKDYTVVGEHVRHPSLTHALLDNYGKRIPKDMEHVDRITEAARLYLEDVESGKIGYTEFVADLDNDKPVPSDKDLFTEQLDQVVNFDNDGNVIFEDVAEEDADRFEGWYDEDPDAIIDLTLNKPVYVWEMVDCIIFDCKELKHESVDTVLKYAYSKSQPDGFYKVYILYNDIMMDSKLRIERFDSEAANKLLEELSRKDTVLC